MHHAVLYLIRQDKQFLLIRKMKCIYLDCCVVALHFSSCK